MNLLALASLDAGRYVHWGVVSISVTNLAIIATTMVVVFVLALLLPFPQSHDDRDGRRP